MCAGVLDAPGDREAEPETGVASSGCERGSAGRVGPHPDALRFRNARGSVADDAGGEIANPAAD